MSLVDLKLPYFLIKVINIVLELFTHCITI